MKKLLITTILGAFLMVPSVLLAQEEGEEGGSFEGDAPAPETIYKKTTVYDFEDDTISGDLTRPDGEYLESRKRSRHQNLIKIRENFNDKVITIIRDMK